MPETVRVTPLATVRGPAHNAFSVLSIVVFVLSSCSCTLKMSPAAAAGPLVPRSPLYLPPPTAVLRSTAVKITMSTTSEAEAPVVRITSDPLLAVKSVRLLT